MALLTMRDLYCGQCGRFRQKQGEPFHFDPCNCTKGKQITGAPYCVFCGCLYHYPEPCGSRRLRDYWTSGSIVEQPVKKSRKQVQTSNQLPLWRR